MSLCSDNPIEASQCRAAIQELHEWVISISSVAADYALSFASLIDLSEIDSLALRSAINQSVYINVKVNGIPAPLMNELLKHTEMMMKNSLQTGGSSAKS